MKKTTIMNKYENLYNNQGYKLIAGIDEVGRGSWAGPIVVAICILPYGYLNNEIQDSKKLSPSKRNQLFEQICNDAIAFHIEIIKAGIVDQLNPKQASILGMEKCIKKIKIQPDFILIDAEKINTNIPNQSIIKGDQLSISIAAASILAKVYRDNLMSKLDQEYANYYFSKHKGYGTQLHKLAIDKYGPIPKIHRFSYKPIINVSKKKIDI